MPASHAAALQRWWDPEWRAQELARRGASGAPRVELDVRTMELTLQALRAGPDEELQVAPGHTCPLSCCNNLPFSLDLSDSSQPAPS